MSIDNTYNGWTNYATWRVNLELFDGMSDDDIGIRGMSAYDGGQYIKNYAEERIEETSSVGLARDYALAFLSDVNWMEIARHKLEEYAEENEA